VGVNELHNTDGTGHLLPRIRPATTTARQCARSGRPGRVATSSLASGKNSVTPPQPANSGDVPPRVREECLVSSSNVLRCMCVAWSSRARAEQCCVDEIAVEIHFSAVGLREASWTGEGNRGDGGVAVLVAEAAGRRSRTVAGSQVAEGNHGERMSRDAPW
jgi:hypothetical protein